MTNSYILRVFKNETGFPYHREVHAFATPEEAEAFVAESRARVIPSRGASVCHSSITEDEAEGLIEVFGCTRHGGADYTDAMWHYDECESEWEEDDLFGEDY